MKYKLKEPIAGTGNPILVLQTLSCLSCAAGTADEATCTTKSCQADQAFCFSAYTVTGSTITVEKGCNATCADKENPRTSCCSKDNCNAPLIKSCQTCDNEKVESNCAEKDCATPSSFCQRKIDFTKDGKITVTKGCEASPGACVPGTVGNKRTTCCNTDLCNVPKLSCLTCDAVTDENTTCQSKACDGTNKFCDSVYDISKKPITATKKCVASCSSKTATTEVKCCSTSDCNDPKLSCYTCNGLADEKQCTVTECSAESKFCKTVRNTIAGKTTAVTKTCEATCTASSTAFQTVECCQASQCNKYQERGTGASPSTQASSLLLAVSISLLTMLLKSA
ncbi:hypothetical protein EOD39_15641 [Acipenser ruthenus]|uniref:Snake toxin/toxin-like domain-containing protein n=1 Tax=Acipenser ruthenus TaxID=7906 RepID=A0A444V7R9_ACIRT|nr:hypothetical protein EOD39_15641 [Acipenser ruthenus]